MGKTKRAGLKAWYAALMMDEARALERKAVMRVYCSI